MKATKCTLGTLLLLSSLFFFSCSEMQEVEKVTMLESKTADLEDTANFQPTRQSGEAHSGKFFSRTDSVNHYGASHVFPLHDSLIQSDIRIYVNVWMRSADLGQRHSFAVALHDGDNVLNWTEFMVDKYNAQPNQWVNIKDSVTFMGNTISKPGMQIKAFPYNNNGKAILDADDIEVTLKKVDKVMVE